VKRRGNIVSIICVFGSFCSLLRGAPLYSPSLEGSEILKVIAAGNGRLPDTLEEMHDIVDAGGKITETIIPFSDSPLFTSLYEPRLVISNSPKFYYAPIPRLDGSTDMEFLSWNNRHNEFDFGRIVNFGKPNAAVEAANVNECMACHKNRAPLFSDRPWLNVNGANAPIGTYISFALLRTLIEREPARYQRFEPLLQMKATAYDPAFGNLAPEPAIALGSILLRGTPVFQLRGSFDLDANTRRGHYLAYTHQILKALRDSSKIAFVRGLTEGALKGILFPEQMGLLFAWDEYLTAWVSSNPELQGLPAENSPVLENFQPLFDNPELLKKAEISDEAVQLDPVEALVKLGKYVQKNQVKAFPVERLPSSGKTFIKLKPNHNGGADTALWLLTDFTKKDGLAVRQQLKVKRISFGSILESPSWGKLWAMPEFPTRTAMLEVFAGALGISVEELTGKSDANPSSHPKPRKPTPLPITESEVRGHSCIVCHNSGPSGMARAFPFDPAKLEAWRKYFSDPQTREEAQDWINGAYERLSGKLMPPPDSEQGQKFSLKAGEWPEIYKFLTQNAK